MLFAMETIELKPIGIIHSPYKRQSQAPFQGIFSDKTFELEIFQEYIDGLKDIEGFSHIIVIYYAHKSQWTHLQSLTPWDSTPHGVYTTCSPFRPNHILLSVVPLVTRKDTNTLVVRQLDALEGTPILDLKPYIPKLMVRQDARIGWMKNKIKF